MMGLSDSLVSIPHFDIKISGSSISDDLNSALVSVEIDNNLYLPDTANLKFLLDVMEDPVTKLPDTDMKDVLNKSSEMVIKDGSNEIFNGEIVSVGVEFNSLVRAGGTYMVVQAFDQSHRLHRGRKTETFLQMSLSDIARKVINDSNLNPDVDATTGVLDYVIQSNQTDWEFLWQLGERVGYEVYVQKNKVYFKKPRQTSGSPVELEWGEDFIQFRSRKSTIKQIPKVKVRAWDRNTKEAIIGEASSANGWPSIGDRRTGGAQASSAFGDSTLVIVDTPLPTQDDATKLAQSVLDSLAGEFIQAEGTTPDGNPKLLPGVKVNLKGLGENSGQYLITSTNHTLNKSEGQSTTFKIGGRNPLTFFPQTGSKHSGTTGSSRIQGIVLGLITNNEDPEGQCRVKIEFPWLDEQIETDWAPIATLGGGNARGFQWLPAVGDQALVAFEHGDVHRPYVIGTIWSEKDPPPHGNSEVTGPDGSVDKIQIKSREGQTLTIDDREGQRSLGLSNPDDDSSIKINHDDKTIEILSNGDINITGSTGKIVVKGNELEVQSAGNLTLEASANVDIKAGANLSLTGGVQATFEGQQTAIKGAQTTLEASAMAEIKGPLVKIN